MTDINYNFLVEVLLDGSIRIHPVMPEILDAVTRVATPADIVSTSLKLAHDLDQQILIDRISGMVLDALSPPIVTVPDQVRDALKDRGITPDAPVADTPAVDAPVTDVPVVPEAPVVDASVVTDTPAVDVPTPEGAVAPILEAPAPEVPVVAEVPVVDVTPAPEVPVITEVPPAPIA